MERSAASTVVVIGELLLARAVARLLPAATVLDADLDPDLREPATAVPLIRRRMEAGSSPAAVIVEARPGFSVLAGLAGLPPQRCFVLAAESPFPAATVRSLVEATGMTFLAQLDALPAVLAGRTAGPAASPERARVRANGGTPEASAGASIAGWPGAELGPPGDEPSGPPPESFSWAAMTPVQVPPAPPDAAAATRRPPRPTSAGVVDAGLGAHLAAGSGPGASAEGAEAGAPLPAYAPADPLRPLRPRRR